MGSNLTSHLEWLGSTVRFQHFLTEALQKCINERPLFWRTESDPQNGGQLEHHFALLFRFLMTPVLGVGFRPPKMGPLVEAFL